MRDRIRHSLQKHEPDRKGRRSDLDLNPTLKGKFRTKYQGRQAAVLVPIRDLYRDPAILLTRRSEHLPDHAGQISFPGGSRERQDRDDTETALREAEEEIGLSPSQVEIIGRIDTYETSTGFNITPVVGLIDPNFEPVRDPYEVEEIFEVPLGYILDRTNHELHSRNWLGGTRHFYAIPYGGYYIWGATAAMLVNFADIIDGKPARIAGE